MRHRTTWTLDDADGHTSRSRTSGSSSSSGNANSKDSPYLGYTAVAHSDYTSAYAEDVPAGGGGAGGAGTSAEGSVHSSLSAPKMPTPKQIYAKVSDLFAPAVLLQWQRFGHGELHLLTAG